MTVKVHDGTSWRGRNILYLHCGGGSVTYTPIKTHQIVWEILLYVQYTSIYLSFLKPKKKSN